MNTTKKVFTGLVVVSMFLAGLTVSTPALAACPTSPGGSATIDTSCPSYQINTSGSTVHVTGTGTVANNASLGAINGTTNFNTTGNTVIEDQGGSILGSILASRGGASTINVDGTVSGDIFANNTTGALIATDTANVTVGPDTISTGSVMGNFAVTVTDSQATVDVSGGNLLAVYGNYSTSTAAASSTNPTAVVTINDGTLGKIINNRSFGGSAIANQVIGGETGGNGTVNITGGTLLGAAEGNQADTTMTGTTGLVNITGGEVDNFSAGNVATTSISGSTGTTDISGAEALGGAIGNLSFGSITNSTGKVEVGDSTVGTLFGNVAANGSLTDGANGTVLVHSGTTVTSNQTDNANKALGAVGNYANGSIDGTSHAVTGTVTLDAGSNVSGAVYGNYADGGTVNTAQANITVNGVVTGNVVGNSGTNISNGTASMIVGQGAVVMGDVYGNKTSGTTTNSSSDLIINGSVFGNVVAGNSSDTATVNPSGMVSGVISGSSSLFPGNPDGNTNVLTLNFGTTTSEADLDRFNAGFGPDGSIVINGKTYTWANWTSVIGTLEYDKIITWFTSNDGRTDGNAWGRIILYCHADKDTLGVLLVNNQSAGNVGTSFKISKLETLGLPGTSVDFGVNGILSIEMGHDGNGYAAWNGGVDGATGQGDFARTFVCK